MEMQNVMGHLQISSRQQSKALTGLKQPSQQQLRDDGSLSVYRDELTVNGLESVIAMAKIAFPGMSEEQLFLLQDRMEANGFTDKRAKDAVCHVMDTYQGYGKLPNIADFIQFDKIMKTYAWNELEHLHNEGKANKGDYGMIKIESKIRYARLVEIERAGIELHVPEDHSVKIVLPSVDMSKFDGMTVEQMMEMAFAKLGGK